MPNKRIKGPTRKGGIKPPTERELDMLRDLYLMRTHQAKNKKKNLRIKKA
tara:strand:- start:173 stop:322 length:150 start_codon:yes stop_codon:yes gene_type:complete